MVAVKAEKQTQRPHLRVAGDRQPSETDSEIRAHLLRQVGRALLGQRQFVAWREAYKAAIATDPALAYRGRLYQSDDENRFLWSEEWTGPRFQAEVPPPVRVADLRSREDSQRVEARLEELAGEHADEASQLLIKLIDFHAGSGTKHADALFKRIGLTLMGAGQHDLWRRIYERECQIDLEPLGLGPEDREDAMAYLGKSDTPQETGQSQREDTHGLVAPTGAPNGDYEALAVRLLDEHVTHQFVPIHNLPDVISEVTFQASWFDEAWKDHAEDVGQRLGALLDRAAAGQPLALTPPQVDALRQVSHHFDTIAGEMLQEGARIGAALALTAAYAPLGRRAWMGAAHVELGRSGCTAHEHQWAYRWHCANLSEALRTSLLGLPSSTIAHPFEAKTS